MKINPLDYRISELNSLEAKKGNLLIAEPFMKDPFFQRSVVLLAENTIKNTLGFILNKSLDIPINDAIEDFPVFDAELFLGGPVQAQDLFFVHTKGNFIPGSQRINSRLHWGGDFEVLKTMVKSGQIFPHEIKFFLGYSGWDKGQLQKEITSESWLIGKQPVEYILDEDTSCHWELALKNLGKRQAMLANFPTDPALN